MCSCEIYPNTDAPKRRTTILEPLAAADSLDCDKYVKQTLAENSKALASVRRVLLGGGLENRRSATLNKVEAYRYNGLGDRCHHLGEYFVGFKSSRHNQKQTMRNASYNRGRHLPRDQASCGRHPWLWFDEHLWLTCQICEARPRWHASVLSGIVSRRVESRRVERGTQGRECDELCAITPQTEARSKTQ